MMRIPPRWIVCAAGCLMLAGCGTVMTAEQPIGPTPDTKAIVLRYLRGEQRPSDAKDTDPGPGRLFGDVQKLGAVELSPPTPLQHPVLGWTWLACLRTHPPGKPASDYALFIGADSIRDARLSVGTDGCATRSYEALGQFSTPAKKKDGQQRGHKSSNR